MSTLRLLVASIALATVAACSQPQPVATTPRPVLAIKRGTEELRVDELEIREIQAGIPRHLERVLDQLRADCWRWDRDQLRLLATKIRSGTEEEADAIACRNGGCPAHGKGVRLAQLQLSLFCPSCQGLLLAEGSITRCQLQRIGFPLVWQVPLDRAGHPGDPVPAPSRAGGRHVCRILDDEDGQRLEIRLVSRNYV